MSFARAIFSAGSSGSKAAAPSAFKSATQGVNWGVVGVGTAALMAPAIEYRRYKASGGQSWSERNKDSQKGQNWMTDYQSHSAEKSTIWKA